MKFLGIDLGGVNSLGCLRVDSNETLCPSAVPERPTVVLFPLVRKERLLAGNEALQNERGLGLSWPPLASATPISHGRELLSSVWQCLITGGQWKDPQWQPPDGLTPINKPLAADCIHAEIEAVHRCAAKGDDALSIVLAIPNQLPEESQEALLSRLRSGTQLVWRSVATAMIWAEDNNQKLDSVKNLFVIDAGVDQIEISFFEYSQKKVNDQVFHVPIRRLNRLYPINTGNLLKNGPAFYKKVEVDIDNLRQYLSTIIDVMNENVPVIICGPLANVLRDELIYKYPTFNWIKADSQIVARGSALFAFRLANHLPTYLDILPSLELFTLTKEHEPNWLKLIPTDCEVYGGSDFKQFLKRPIFIEKDTQRMVSLLQRSGGGDFRKLLTDLPIRAAQNAWVDLSISARSAGGLARVSVTPSSGQYDVFGAGQSVMLNWQSMERIPRIPDSGWPVEIKYGWPACGKIYASRHLFKQFFGVFSYFELESKLQEKNVRDRINFLDLLKRRVKQTVVSQMIKVNGISGGAAPANLLVCFGTDTPCQFLEDSFSGKLNLTTVNEQEESEALRIANVLWKRLGDIVGDGPLLQKETDEIISILGRMSGYAPESFQEYLISNLYADSGNTLLFAIGRVVQTPKHGRTIFSILKDKINACQTLNMNWLRMLVYILYQREEVLLDADPKHISVVASHCIDILENQANKNKIQRIFLYSLRVLALLLRTRRYEPSRNFLSTLPQLEDRTGQRLENVLKKVQSLSLTPAMKLLLERVLEWLDCKANTNEMPPISTPGEEND